MSEENDEGLDAITDEAVNEFLADLANAKQSNIQKASSNEEVATKDNVEEFVLKNSSEVVNSALNILKSFEGAVQHIQSPDEIAAYSELVNASTNALDTLNKIVIQNKKADAAKEVKLLDIESKQQLQANDHKMKLMASREDIMKMIMGEDLIDVTPEDSQKDQEPS